MEAYCYSRPDPDALGLAESFDSCVKRSHAALLRCELESTLAQIDSSDFVPSIHKPRKRRHHDAVGTRSRPGARHSVGSNWRSGGGRTPPLCRVCCRVLMISLLQHKETGGGPRCHKRSPVIRAAGRREIGCETAPESVHQWSLASDNLADKTVQLLRQRFRG